MNQWHYGVVVGINRYPDIRDLNYARGDAEKFSEWLVDPKGGGVPIGNVKQIIVDDIKMPDGTSREDAAPNREDLFNALYKFRKAVEDHVKKKPEDWKQTRLYFYVSGHGIAPDANDAALLMANAGPDWYGENISCARLIAFLTKNQAFREIVVFADCCRERVPNAPLGDVSPPWTLVERNNGPVLSVFGCATYFGDLAYEPPEDEMNEPDKQRGYFTQALLEGLQGLRAADPDTGEINSRNLAKYVRNRVRELTQKRQTPTMEGNMAESIIFRQPSAKAVELRQEVRLEFVTPYQGKVELWDGTKMISQHDTANGPWVEQLPKGLYEVRTSAGSAAPFVQKGRFMVWGEDIYVQL